MKFSLKAALAASFSALALLQLGMHHTGEIHKIIRIALDNPKVQMKQLQSMDLDIAGVDLDQHTVDIVASGDDQARIEKLGYRVVSQKSLAALASPDQEYQTPAEVEAILKNYEARFPQLASVVSAGKSVEGRDIWAIKITKDVKNHDPSKPVIFFNGMHHAREVMSVEVPLDTIDTLLNGYGKDPKITHWVDANEIWVMPMLNVDGNNKVWTSYNMWRKNTQGGFGVDINRNYPYAWGTCNGSSGSKMSDTFRGDGPGSEPETQTMMNFVKSIRPVFSISYHSYSEIVIYPFGCEGQHTPTREVVEGIGQELGTKIVKDNGRGTYEAGTSTELLYAVDGSDIDWFYAETKVIPYVIEVNSSGQGFQPSYSKWRESTVKRLRPGWQFLLDRLDGSSLHGKVLNAKGKTVKDAVIKITRTSGSSKAPYAETRPVNADGYYMVILPAGQYQVTFEAPGMEPRSESINIGNSRVEMNTALNSVSLH